MLKRIRNNKGMSLVEVIISITILTIVIVPTLNVLTSAMAYNIKARRRQQATIMAESIMEAFKGYDIETLKEKFDDGTFSAGGVTSTDESTGDGVSYTCTNDGGVYEFKINQYKDNGRTYNVTIEATPNTETTSNTYVQYAINPANSGTYIGTVDESNDDAVREAALGEFEKSDVNIAGLLSEANSSKYCGEGKSATNSDGVVLNASNIKLDKDNIVIDSRTMTFNINKVDGFYAVDCELEYKYHIKDFTFYVQLDPASFTDPLEGDNPTYEKGGKLYYLEEKSIPEYYPTNGSFKTEKQKIEEITGAMEYLYIYYYPYYDTSDNSDKIYIYNKTSEKINCYVLKQKYTDISLSALGYFEQNYEPEFGGLENVKVYHNFNVNLSDNKMFDKFTNTDGVTYDIANTQPETYEKADLGDRKKELTVLYDIKLTMYDVTDVADVTDDANGNKVAYLESVMYETVGGASVEEKK